MNDDNPYRSPREYGEGGAQKNIDCTHWIAAAALGLGTEIGLIVVDTLFLGNEQILAPCVYGSAFMALIACIAALIVGPPKKN